VSRVGAALRELLPTAWHRCPRCAGRLGHDTFFTPVRLLQPGGSWHEVCASCGPKLRLVGEILTQHIPTNPGLVPTLEQTTWWFGQDGRPYQVADMDVEHLRNLLAYLRRHASRLRDHRRWWESYHTTESEDALRARQSRELADRSDADWLRDRPLVRALEAELRRRDAVDAEVVDVSEVALPETRPSVPRHRRSRELEAGS
jgi:hypothetical protein